MREGRRIKVRVKHTYRGNTRSTSPFEGVYYYSIEIKEWVKERRRKQKKQEEKNPNINTHPHP